MDRGGPNFWRMLHKFGPYHCDLPTMLWNISFLFRGLSLNIDSRYKKRIPVICYMFTLISTVSYYYTYLISLIWFVFIRCMEAGDLTAAMVAISLGVSSEIAMVKLILLFITVNRIRKLGDDYLECDCLVVRGTRFHKNLLKYSRNVKMRAILFWTTIMMNSVCYIIAPVFIPGRHLPEDLLIIYGLEPMLESPNYEIAVFLMSISVLLVCYVTANITSFIIITVGYTETQLRSLSIELTNVWEDALHQYYVNVEYITQDFCPNHVYVRNEANDQYFINMDVKRRLVQIIKSHSRNIMLLRQVEWFFRESMAFGFLFLIFSLIAELLGGLENTYIQVPFTFCQMAMDCFTGQKLIDASLTFERAVYDCKWENFDVKNMKIVLLMLRNSQKTLTLSAGGMMVVSFSSLMTIVRSVYSTYTGLRSTIK